MQLIRYTFKTNTQTQKHTHAYTLTSTRTYTHSHTHFHIYIQINTLYKLYFVLMYQTPFTNPSLLRKAFL